jgi:hypothetical protein
LCFNFNKKNHGLHLVCAGCFALIDFPSRSLLLVSKPPGGVLKFAFTILFRFCKIQFSGQLPVRLEFSRTDFSLAISRAMVSGFIQAPVSNLCFLHGCTPPDYFCRRCIVWSGYTPRYYSRQ